MNEKIINDILEGAEIQPTPARLAILSLFASHAQPLDIGTILTMLTGSKSTRDIDRATVFRTLNTFVARGLVQKLEFNEGKARYELAGKGHHNHTICTVCGVVACIDECNLDTIEREIEKSSGFKSTLHRAEFFGICSACQNRAV